MGPYSGFRPDANEQHVFIEGREDWLVVPIGRARDSPPHCFSAFSRKVRSLGGEGQDLEVHRFKHWGCGWFELILVRPGSIAAKKAARLERRKEGLL